MAALNAANGRPMSPSPFQTEAAPKVRSRQRAACRICRAPRTITDITAILDSEKADLKTIEELKAEADCQPDRQGNREDLAQFYFDRGNARAQLGRLADTIADANKAIEVGRGPLPPS